MSSRRHRAHGRTTSAHARSAWSLHPQLAAGHGSGRRSGALARAADERRQLSLADPGAAPAGADRAHRSRRDEQAQLMTEIDAARARAQDVTACDKLNVAALGNRCRNCTCTSSRAATSDAAWPKPVWGVVPATAYDRRARRLARRAAARARKSKSPSAARPSRSGATATL